MTTTNIPDQFSLYDWMELLGFSWKVQNEGYEYAAENYAPRFESDALRAIAADDDPRPLKKLFNDNQQALEEWQEAAGWEEAGRLMDAHQREEKERKEAHLPWGLHPGGGWDFGSYSKAFETRDEALKAIAQQNEMAEKYEHFVPFAGRLLHREVPGGEWAEVPLSS